ncbi:MAG: serine/threonine-protein kinase [Gemmatales bacterium]
MGSDHFIELLKQPSVVEEAASTIVSSAQFSELPAELRNHSRYSIQKRLGRGGMGMVYHAIHRLMNRQVALKMIRGDLLATPVAVTRFRREVQAAAHLDHANIVTAFDAEEVSGVHFLVMEYVEGKSLDQLVNQKGPLAVPLVCTIARQIAQGLHHAHSLGMIHRDIKPNNVMITRQGKVKILDFGLARWSGRREEKTLPQITMAGSHLGTLMYAAPEQRKSAGEVDVRADLYSLGATMVYLLTGKPPPFVKDDLPTEELTLPHEVPLEMQAIIRRLLMPLPQDRYPNAKSVVDALSSFSNNNNISSVAASPVKGLRYALLGRINSGSRVDRTVD